MREHPGADRGRVARVSVKQQRLQSGFCGFVVGGVNLLTVQLCEELRAGGCGINYLLGIFGWRERRDL